MAVQYGPLFRFVEAGQRSSGIAPVAAPPRDRRSTNQEMDGTAGYWSVSDRHKSNPCGAAIIPDTRSIGRLFEEGRELLRYRGRFCRRGTQIYADHGSVYLRQSRTAASLHRTSDRQWGELQDLE